MLREAIELIKEIGIKQRGDGAYFAGYKIWLCASARNAAIKALADECRDVFKQLGAQVHLLRDLDNAAKAQLNDADIILIFAASPGASARTLEICFDSRSESSGNTSKMCVYMPEEFVHGFIYRRFCHYNLRVRQIDSAEFSSGKTEVLRRCIFDICEHGEDSRRQQTQRMLEFTPTIGIVTALGVELAAVTNILSNLQVDPIRKDEKSYSEFQHGTITSKRGGEHRVVVALAGKGNNKAAALGTSLVHQYPSVNVLFMVGVAAGVPNPNKPADHVRLGDIVVSGEQGVFQYDMIKKYTSKTQYVAPPRPPDAGWLALMDNYSAQPDLKADFQEYLSALLIRQGITRPLKGPLRDCAWAPGRSAVRQPPQERGTIGFPKIHSGLIASANTVLKNAAFRNKLRNFGVKAIEMEASGLAESAWTSGKGYFVIRGICDFANDDKNKIWQPYAAAAAAAFAHVLIGAMPLAR